MPKTSGVDVESLRLNDPLCDLFDRIIPELFGNSSLAYGRLLALILGCNMPMNLGAF